MQGREKGSEDDNERNREQGIRGGHVAKMHLSVSVQCNNPRRKNFGTVRPCCLFA